MRTIQPKTYEQARIIREGLGQGKTLAEIAGTLGVSSRRLCYVAKKFHIHVSPSHMRQFTFQCTERQASVIKALALDARVTPAEMTSRIVGTVVGGGMAEAKRKLGRLAMAPKVYRRATSG
jgi:hypothetical protein